ncbi:MAG: septal ring lytic transglycosylase RlpA family protein [Chloroflexota bacterium]
MRLLLTTVLLTATLTIGPLSGIASAESATDLTIPGGHFYTQANGTSIGPRGGGFEITDANDVPFWTFFNQTGGVDVLGYPVSQRFLWDGYVCQATQRAILQWNPATNQVQLANIFDYLSGIGKDDWLLAAHLAPKPDRVPQESQPLSFLMLAHWRFSWLYADPAIFHRYFSTPSYYAVFGLPTSPVVDLGPYHAVRFQRAVIYHWKFSVPWADDRGTSVGLAGDLLKELGLIPTAALQPRASPGSTLPNERLPATSSPRMLQLLTAVVAPRQAAAPPPEARSSAAPLAALPSKVSLETSGGDPALVGVSTWYGQDFQGRTMSDGRPYDMWNPNTAASNVYPLGTWIRITRLTTGRSIVVEVTDRGAFTYPNVADLSYAAFSLLANPSNGVIGVRVEPVSGGS